MNVIFSREYHCSSDNKHIQDGGQYLSPDSEICLQRWGGRKREDT
jgi:hypothetical protein